MINIQYFKTPFGEMILGSFNDKLCLADWRYRKKREAIDNRLKKGLSVDYVEQSSAVIELTKNQLTAYFKKDIKQFSIPLLLVGTEFQKNVWNTLLNIPYGKTYSYLKLSEIIGNKKAIRAVASANGANAISIIIPCHRIIGSNNELVGYAGGIDAKKKLLALEGASAQLSLF